MNKNNNNNSNNFITNSINYITGGSNQNSNPYNNHFAQAQQQVSLQKIVQLQDQDTRNFTLGGLLSGLETIVYLQLSSSQQQILKKKYDGYNPKSVQDKKNIDQLITQIRIQSKSFQNLYEECCDKYGDYWFPDNLNREEIINDISFWKKLVDPKYKVYYDNIIHILEGEEEKVEYPKLKRIKKEGRASCDPEKQLKLIPPNIAYINYRRKIVKKNYLEKNAFNNNLELYKEDHCDPAFEKMNKRYKKALESHDKNCICDDCCPTIDSLI